MAKDDRIKVGSVVQIDPAHDDVFGASLLIVTEMKSWGVMGYVQIPGKDDKGGQAFYRVPFEKIEYVGEAVWTMASHTDKESNDETT